MTDPIVEEVRRARDAHAKRFNYDLDAIVETEETREGVGSCDGLAASQAYGSEEGVRTRVHLTLQYPKEKRV